MTKQDANYCLMGWTAKCGTCAHALKGNRCALVKGWISMVQGVCDRWERQR